MLGTQPVERPVERVSQLGPLGLGQWTRAGRGRDRQAGGERLGVWRSPSQGVDGCVVGDSEEPGWETPGRIERLQAAKRLQERVL